MERKDISDEIIYAGKDIDNSIFSIILAGYLSGGKSRVISIPEKAYVIGYLMSGTASITSSGARFNVNGKEMFFVNADASAELQLTLSGGSSGYWFFLDGTLPRAVADAYSIPAVSIRRADVNGLMINLKDLLRRADESDSFDSIETMKKASAIFFNIMLEFAFTENPVKEKKSGVRGTEAEEIRNYIDNMIYSDPSLEDIRTHFGITKMHAIRVFKTEYEMTPMQYAIKRRSEVAATLLATTDLPIKTISEMLHYSNTQHFSNSFKKLIGMSPNRYRSIEQKKQ